MKKVIGALVLAAALIAIGLLTEPGDGSSRQARDQADEHYRKGMEHLFAFQYTKANEELRAALELDPDHAMAATALTELTRRLGRREESEQLLVQADSLAARTPERERRVLTQLWLSNFLESHYRERQDSLLTLARDVDSTSLIVLHTLAARADAGGDAARVEELWHRILELHPNYANAYNMLGYLAFYRGRYSEAVSYMRKYAFIAPDLANPHDSLGEVLMTIGQYEEAEENFKQALAKQPDFFYSLINIGRIYIARGQLEKGVDILEGVRREMEGTEIARRIDQTLIGVYYDNRLLDELDRATARYVDNYPDGRDTAYYRAMRLLFGGQSQQAHALIDSTVVAWRELPLYQNNVNVRARVETAQDRFRALEAQEKGSFEAAADIWGTVLARTNDLPPHELFFDRERYAQSLLESGQFAEALDQLELVLQVNPRLIRPLTLAVKAHVGLGQQREAEKLLEQLADALRDADPDYPCRGAYAQLVEAIN